MRRESILFARVPETGHEEHEGLFLLALLFRGRGFVLLALLDDFGFGGGGRGGSAFGRRGGGFGAEGDDVGDHGLRVADQLHGAGEGDIAAALGLADHELADIDDKLLGDVIGEAREFDGAGDDFEESALDLDAGGLAFGEDGDGDADALGEIDALEIGMEQGALDGIDLAIDDHDGSGFPARDGEFEDGVETGGRANNLDDFAGVDGHADRVLVCAVNHGGMLPALRVRRASFFRARYAPRRLR